MKLPLGYTPPYIFPLMWNDTWSPVRKMISIQGGFSTSMLPSGNKQQAMAHRKFDDQTDDFLGVLIHSDIIPW